MRPLWLAIVATGFLFLTACLAELDTTNNCWTSCVQEGTP